MMKFAAICRIRGRLRWAVRLVSLGLIVSPGWLLAQADAGPGAGAPLTVQPKQCSVEGRVIDAGDGRPIPGVLLELYNVGESHDARTGDDGRFRFEHLGPRTYGLRLTPTSAFVAQRLVVNLAVSHDLTGVALKVFRAAVISGRVLDAERQPVADVRVLVLQGGDPGGRYRPGMINTQRTNERGEYRISKLSPGSYRLLVLGKPLAISASQREKGKDVTVSDPVVADVPTFYSLSRSIESAIAVQVRPGQVLEDMDISILRENTRCIQSKVVDSHSEAAEQVNVIVSADLYLGSASLADGAVGTGVNFEVCGLPRGDYSLVARLAQQGDGKRYASTPFSITDRGVRVPDLQLQPPVPVRGTLAIEADTDKPALGGSVAISLVPIGRPRILDERAYAAPTKEGPFEIPAVMPGWFWVTIRPPSGFYVTSATMAGVDALQNRVYASGSDAFSVVLKQGGATVSVRAVDGQGAPVQGATAILGQDPQGGQFTSVDVISRPCDQDGRAVFDGVPPGHYRILAYGDLWDDSVAADPRFFLAHRSAGAEITLSSRDKRSLDITVLESRDGN